MTAPLSTIPAAYPGRGAWLAGGKGNGSPYYEYIEGKPLDGIAPVKDLNYQAVNLGVKAIQKEINAQGYTPALIADGMFGAKSRVAVQWLQTKYWNAPTGIFGPSFARFIWRRIIQLMATEVGVDPKYLYGYMRYESNGDPGAVGYYTPSDRGLIQINVVAHYDITPQQAFDPEFAFRYAARRFKSEWDSHADKGPELQEIYAIAQHNSPASARRWYTDGVPPSAKILEYVTKVKYYASSW